MNCYLLVKCSVNVLCEWQATMQRCLPTLLLLDVENIYS
uniref:Uncharacterized protein n=1 Tax=Anguilla anguilla TaxID=7936 RepID=A0A0E9RFZ0_ANGAN